jgi:hypothetical protein
MLPNATIDLLRKDLETFIAEKNRLSLLLLRDRRRHRQLVPGLERDRLGHRPHVLFETVEPGMHLVKTLLNQVLDRRRRIHKMLKSGFHEHALAHARSVGCGVESSANSFANPNGDLTAR